MIWSACLLMSADANVSHTPPVIPADDKYHIFRSFSNGAVEIFTLSQCIFSPFTIVDITTMYKIELVALHRILPLHSVRHGICFHPSA